MHEEIPQPLPPPQSAFLWNNPKTRTIIYRVTITVVILVVLCAFYIIGTRPEAGIQNDESNEGGEQTQDQSTPTSFGKNKDGQPVSDSSKKGGAIPQRTVGSDNSFKLIQKSTGACSGIVPEGWSAFSSPRSDAADFVSSDKTMYAGYGALGVNPAFQVYDPELYSPTPEVSIKRLGGLIISGTFGDSSPLSYTNDYNQKIGDYTLRSVESQGSKGVVFYRIFPGDGINYSYAEVARFALAKKQVWSTKGELIARVAASLNCSVQFSPSDQAVVGGGSSDTSTKDQNGDEYGYNPQLGTEYVHDENGTNYLVSPSDGWSETGPDGGGYYKGTATGWEKLKPGRSD